MKRLLIIIALVSSAVAFTGCNSPKKASPSQENNVIGYAVSTLSAVNHHEEPDVDKEIGCQSLMGTLLSVLEYSNGWYKVETPEHYVAWVSAEAIALKEGDELDRWLNSDKLRVTAVSDMLYSEPYLGADIVCDITLGDVLIKGELNSGFYS